MSCAVVPATALATSVLAPSFAEWFEEKKVLVLVPVNGEERMSDVLNTGSLYPGDDLTTACHEPHDAVFVVHRQGQREDVFRREKLKYPFRCPIVAIGLEHDRAHLGRNGAGGDVDCWGAEASFELGDPLLVGDRAVRQLCDDQIPVSVFSVETGEASVE